MTGPFPAHSHIQGIRQKEGNAQIQSVVLFASNRIKESLLTFWRRIFFLNFSTSCILNVSNTETKQGSIMK